MIVPEYSNSTNATSRTLAEQARPANRDHIVYIAQAPDGYWHWHRRITGCTYTSRERYAGENLALQAAASIATGKGARLKVTPAQQAYIICYWLAVGEERYRMGYTLAELPANRHIRQGWWEAAQQAAVSEEADAKPGYDTEVDPAPTLEEALALQERLVAERIQANRRLLNGEAA